MKRILITPNSEKLPDNQEHRNSWHVDEIMLWNHDITENLDDLKIEDDAVFFIPTILNSDNALAYDGAELALRIFFRYIKANNANIRIVLLGVESSNAFMLHYPYPNILKIPNFSYTYFNRTKVAQFVPDETSRSSEIQEYKHLIELLGIQLPASLKSSHSMTNEWCLYKWSEFMGFECGNNNAIANSLYFDYLKAQQSIEGIRTKGTPEKLKNKIKELSKEKETRILLIDDNPEWHNFFSSFFAESNIKLRAIGQDFKKFEFEEVSKHIQKEVQQYNPDIILLDFRLMEDSDYNAKSAETISGAKLLKLLKGTSSKPGLSFGSQVIIFTATSHIENILMLKQQGADGFILKEKPSQYIGKKTTGENIKEAVTLFKTAISRAELLFPLNEKLCTIEEVSKTHEKATGENVKNAISTTFQSIRNITQHNSLSENILKLVYLNLFGIFEEITRDSNFVEWPNNSSLVIKANSELRICNQKECAMTKSSENFKPLYAQGSEHHEYCKVKSSNFAISALILFRLGKSHVDDTEWNTIRKIRNRLAHNDKTKHKGEPEITIDKLKEYTIKMLDLIEELINPEKINEVKPTLKP